jgi:pyridoxal 5'-phosphate synthase pdxS subunit
MCGQQILAEVSTNLGAPMVGISDIKGDAVNFRDREGGDEGHVPKKLKLTAPTEAQLYGSSWKH